MSPNLTLVLVSGVLVAAGVYLLLERSLTRILVGVLLASNGVNVLFLVSSGAAGGAPIIGVTPAQEMSDPLPQAMVLTAIVISLAMIGFLLALSYRLSAAVGGLLIGLLFSMAFMTETTEHRVVKAGFPPGTAARLREERAERERVERRARYRRDGAGSFD